jgi:hypothetical protein
MFDCICETPILASEVHDQEESAVLNVIFSLQSS